MPCTPKAVSRCACRRTPEFIDKKNVQEAVDFERF
jgi:hypothetical protein